MLFKVTDTTGKSVHGIDAADAQLPTADGPGPWLPAVEGDLEYQKKGYHCGDERQILEWLGHSIYAVEHEGELLEVPRAKVARKIRLTKKCSGWTDQVARQFAVECAQRVLPVFEAASQSQAPHQALEKALAAPADLVPDNPADATPAALAYADEMDELKAAAVQVAEAIAAEHPLAANAANAAASAASGYDPGSVAAKEAAMFARLARGPAAAQQEEGEWQANRLLEILNG